MEEPATVEERQLEEAGNNRTCSQKRAEDLSGENMCLGEENNQGRDREDDIKSKRRVEGVALYIFYMISVSGISLESPSPVSREKANPLNMTEVLSLAGAAVV